MWHACYIQQSNYMPQIDWNESSGTALNKANFSVLNSFS